MKTEWFFLAVLAFVVWIYTNDSKPTQETSYKYNATSQQNNSERQELRQSDNSPTYSYSEPLTYKGYPCTIDCSGHEAGYEWAETNGIEDPNDCDGNSNSFIEGCMSYTEELASNLDDLTEQDLDEEISDGQLYDEE